MRIIREIEISSFTDCSLVYSKYVCFFFIKLVNVYIGHSKTYHWPVKIRLLEVFSLFCNTNLDFPLFFYSLENISKKTHALVFFLVYTGIWYILFSILYWSKQLFALFSSHLLAGLQTCSV